MGEGGLDLVHGHQHRDAAHFEASYVPVVMTCSARVGSSAEAAHPPAIGWPVTLTGPRQRATGVHAAKEAVHPARKSGPPGRQNGPAPRMGAEGIIRWVEQ